MKPPLILPIPPSSNHRLMLVKGRFVTSPEAREYKEQAHRRALAHGLRPIPGDVSFTMNVYRPRRAGDLDNYLKLVWDALSGAAWHDDAQVSELHAYRYEDKERPRVEVWVSQQSETR